MNRWVRLVAAVVAMMMVGNLQYVWTLFVQPIISANGWKLSEVQWGFTFFVAFGTWSMPLAGMLIDRLGPRLFMSLSALLCGFGWAMMGKAHSLTELYVYYSIAGFGVAFVYCCAIAIALKWFPDKRGLASGLITAGYGSGAALFIPVYNVLMHSTNYRVTFLYTGVAQGVLILMAGLFLQNPRLGEVPKAVVKKKVRLHGNEEFNAWQMLKAPQFYALYIMMLLVGIGGLMATAQVGPVAKNFKIGSTALAIGLTLNPLANGGGRIFWGQVSDHFGREWTMFVAFFLQSLVLLSVVTLGRHGDGWFVASMALVFFTWGEVYVLFPAVLADMFGVKYAATNYSILYSTKGLASIPAGALAALLFEKSGSWDYVFYGSAAMALLASLGAIALTMMPSPKLQRHGMAAVQPIQVAVPEG